MLSVVVVSVVAGPACKHRARKLDAAGARAAWIAQVERYVAKPATIPRLADPAGRKQLEALLSEPAWLAIDGATFARDGDALLQFFPASKALSGTLRQLGAVDELALFVLYLHDVSGTFIAAAVEMMQGLPAGDETLPARSEGLEQVRIGAAMNLADVLAALPETSPPVARQVVARLVDEHTYARHSATSLQLLVATLDEAVLPTVSGELQVQLAGVRDVIANRHDAVAATAPPVTRIYEGLRGWTTAETRPVPSRGGGFVIDVGAAPLVWTSRTPGRDGQPTIAYQLEWRRDTTLLEVGCHADVAEDDIVRQFAGRGATARTGPAPGHWFTTSTATAAGGIRITTIAGRTCVAGIESTPGQLSDAQIDATLGSLRPAS